MKYINFKRLNFSIIPKYINNLRYNFLKIFKFIDFGRFNLKKLYKYLDVYKYLDISSFSFKKYYKNINLKKYKSASYYFFVSLFIAAFVYLVTPIFYKYDKSKFEKIICKDKEIECLIRGKVRYSFYPTPRVNINDLIIKDSLKKKNTLAIVKQVSIKLSFFNLFNKQNQKFKEIQLKKFDINFYLNNIKKYKNIFKENISFIPIYFKDGRILFFDKKDHIASINESNFNLVFTQDEIKIKLKGKFLNDNIYLNINTKKEEKINSSDIILKISKLNLLTKANVNTSKDRPDAFNGNILIKKDKNKITAVIEYMDNEIKIIKSNLSNAYLEGKSEGKITFSPYFNFNIDVTLNSINFTKLYNYFLSLDESNKQKVFKINQKINGNLILSSDKIYSGYNLAKSFESRLKFNNGNIIIEQFIVNLGKLGAADLLGKIDNTDKSTNLKFESNVFVDNQKKFLSKFGIYNKKSIQPSFFVSGNFDIDNLRMHFYEIFYKEKSKDEDVNYIENEFNNLMLEDGYKTLFHFPQFKEFIKSITGDIN